MARLAPTATATAAASGAARPTTEEASSSVRPASSSARVRRITVKIAIRPTRDVPTAPTRQAEMAPTEVPVIGPVMARNAGFAEMLWASAARSACSGYSAAMVENVDAATGADAEDPGGQRDPFAPQVEPDQRAGAGQPTSRGCGRRGRAQGGGHRAAALCCLGAAVGSAAVVDLLVDLLADLLADAVVDTVIDWGASSTWSP